MPTYPDVPIAPGVPPVLRNPNAVIGAAIELLTGDSADALGENPGPQWGLFDDSGQLAIEADSVRLVDFRKEYRISDYPVEGGGFQSYNKVETPFDFMFSLTKAETIADRQAFLSAGAAITASTDLYNCVTPEETYSNANAVRYGYRRTAENGATLITLDLYMEEVRQTATSTFSNTASPTSTDPVQDGVVQPTSITGQQQSEVDDAMDGIGGF